jgi:alpha-ribazole phosphatase
MRIYLIRHGQTVWNKENRVQGNRDVELNETGLKQAELTSEYLKNRAIDLFYCSDLTRAVRTAKIINRFHNKAITQLPVLREICYGEWEGRNWQEITARDPDLAMAWRNDRVNVAPPGGESFQDLYRRVADFVTLVKTLDHQAVAVVTHEGVIKALLCHFLRVDPARQRELSYHNGSISTVEYDPVTKQFSAVSLNDYSHLPE